LKPSSNTPMIRNSLWVEFSEDASQDPLWTVT
jgi:hypothetical protein